MCKNQQKKLISLYGLEGKTTPEEKNKFDDNYGAMR